MDIGRPLKTVIVKPASIPIPERVPRFSPEVPETENPRITKPELVPATTEDQ